MLKKIFASGIILSLALFLAISSQAATETRYGNAVVFADVIGSKPVVRLFDPTNGLNGSDTLLNKIVGLNFGSTEADILGVFLDDDPVNTSLIGTPTLHHNCDITGNDCDDGDSDIYQSITGLSVPSGVAPGIYNILVTTAAGTNIVSNYKFTVTLEASGTTPTFIRVAPGLVSLVPGVANTINMKADITDASPGAIVHFDVAPISTPGVSSSAEGSPIVLTMLGGSGTAAFTVSGDSSTGMGVSKVTLRAGDGGSPTTGNTATKEVDIVILPW